MFRDCSVQWFRFYSGMMLAVLKRAYVMPGIKAGLLPMHQHARQMPYPCSVSSAHKCQSFFRERRGVGWRVRVGTEGRQKMEAGIGKLSD